MPWPNGAHLHSPTVTAPDASSLARGVIAGERRALARAITLVESRRADHRREANDLIAQVIGRSGSAVRLGVSGAPGVGKSTFIDAFGTYLTALGHRVAVLAVDPSSRRTGGSILGDKTRMPALARDPNAFIRPSPAAGTLGGVARRTREAMLLCEAAGFDVVIVETVGVGQSELAVADMVDLFLLLVSPGGGDELQGIKRGIMELADLVIVTKADGDLAATARHACADHRKALGLLRPHHRSITPQALLVSSVSGKGIDNVWSAVSEAHEALRASGELDEQRSQQRRSWLWSEIAESLLERLRADPKVAALVDEVEAAVDSGSESPVGGARRLLEAFQR